MRQTRVRLGNRRGATIMLVAVSLAAILALGAISVDLSMLFKMRGDAQRTADAAALAGASAFKEFDPLDARDAARDRAFKYIADNYVGSTKVDTSGKTLTVNGQNWIITANETKVEISPTMRRVRVTVRRPSAPTFFGRILAVTNSPISAWATAEATNAGGAKCVKPFAIADPWDDANEDGNADDWWGDGEEWSYNPADGDYYRPWDGSYTEPSTPYETGYGSVLRDDNSTYERDWGRQLIIKPQNPQVDQMIKPGHFFAWDMPDDSTQNADCGIGGGSGNAGASDYSQNICSCNNTEIYADSETSYDLKTGNMQGPTRFGVEDLIDLDPGARWDPTAMDGDNQGRVVGSSYNNWRDSPRVIKVALYDPDKLYKSGKISVTFNNIALMFVEDYHKKDDAVIGRFITFAEGSGNPGPGGPLAKVLRLVE